MPKFLILSPDPEVVNEGSYKEYDYAGTLKIEKQVDLVAGLHSCPHQHPKLGEIRVPGRHNNLYKNPFNNTFWFWNDHDLLFRLREDGIIEKAINYPSRGMSLYNRSLVFASENLLVYSNGLYLMAMYRGDGHDYGLTSNDFEAGIVMDVNYREDKGLIQIATACTIQVKDRKRGTKVVVLTYPMATPTIFRSFLELEQKLEFYVDGTIDLVKIEKSCEYIVIVGQTEPRIIFDSRKQKYCWIQDDDYLTIWLRIPKVCMNTKPALKILPRNIQIKFEKRTVLSGSLPYALNPSIAVWKRTDDILKLKLKKFLHGEVWDAFIGPPNGGEYYPNDTPEDEIIKRLRSFNSYLDRNEQSESDDTSEESKESDSHLYGFGIYRMKLEDYDLTHVVVLNDEDRVVFVNNTYPNPMLLIKHYRDGYVWEITGTDDDWRVVHKKTFPLFAGMLYYHSKHQFFLTPPSAKYLAVVEELKFVCVYAGPNPDEPEESRKGIRWNIDLDKDEYPILGAVAADNYIMVLTKRMIHRVNIIVR